MRPKSPRPLYPPSSSDPLSVSTTQAEAPSLEAIRANRGRLGEFVLTTPIRLLSDDSIAAAVGAATRDAEDGGGLIAGVACAVKQMSPQTLVYAMEPEGADSLNRSFKCGSPQSIEEVRTIADSLGAPRCEPYSYSPSSRPERRPWPR
jgi:hypothetical protein